MTHYELPIFAFLAALLVLIPLPCQWRTGNIAGLAIIAWAFAVDVVYGINSTIWANNALNAFPIWCDIVTKIIIGASYALPISFFCICKHLEEVSSSRKITFESKDRQRRMIFEAVMCFGLPFVFLGLHYIVQDHRFDIIEDIGCQPTVYVSIPAIFISWFPQLLFSLICMIYAIIALHHFIRRRLTFASHLKDTKSEFTTVNQYFWLISMIITNMTWNTIVTILNLYNNVSGGLRPWTSWNDVHSQWNRVDVWSRNTIPSGSHRIIMLLWWSVPVSSFIFFIFQYGFSQVIKEEYIRGWIWLKRTIFCGGRHQENRDSVSTSYSLRRPRLKPLNLVPVHHKRKGLSSIFNSALISCTSSLVSCPARMRKHFSRNSVTGTCTRDAPSTINFSTDDLPRSQMHSNSLDRTTTGGGSSLRHARVGVPFTQLPEIPPFSPFSSYLPSSSSLVDPSICPPDPAYHRPFCGPSIYPVTRMSQLDGIVVTVHRHASTDAVV